MNWKLYVQNPEDYDDQGLYLKADFEDPPWQTETDCEEFDAFHNPSTEGYSIRDLASAQRWAEGYGLNGLVTEMEIL